MEVAKPIEMPRTGTGWVEGGYCGYCVEMGKARIGMDMLGDGLLWMKM